MVKVLFVCLGNICRSPTADAVFVKMVAQAGYEREIKVDSAGTGSWHIGEKPDSRATVLAERRGYDLSRLRARQVCAEDFVEFDYILAMDETNYEDLKLLCPEEHQAKLHYFLYFAPKLKLRSVPDPYFDNRFEQVLDMVEEAAQGLLDYLCRKV